MNIYEQGQAFGGVIDVLEAIEAHYAIWGGMAVIAYGEPRFTQAMDILLAPRQFLAAQFVRRLRESHYHVDEIAVNNALVGGYFNVIHLAYHIKVDLYVPGEPELLAMINERVYFPFDEIRRAAYITADALVISKLRAFQDSQSTRHLDDIGSIIRLQGNKLAQDNIALVAARSGLLGVWRTLWRENRPG